MIDQLTDFYTNIMFGLFAIITFPMCGCCCTASEQFFGYIMVRTSYIRIDDDVLFVLEQQAELDLYGASSLMKQQSMGRYGSEPSVFAFTI